MDDNTNLPFVGLETAPEVHVDGYHGSSLVAGAVKINFYTTLFDPVDNKQIKKAAMVLNCSPVVIWQIKEALTVLCDHLIKDGVLSPPPTAAMGKQDVKG